MKETFLSICKSHLAHDKNTDNDKAYKVKNFLTTVLPLRPWQAGTLCQTAFWGLAVPCPLPPTPCLGPDAPRLGKARSWPAHQGQFHLGSSQERGQCCRLPSAWGGRPAFLGCKVSVQRRSPALPEPRSPGHGQLALMLPAPCQALNSTLCYRPPGTQAPARPCAALLSSEGLSAQMGLEEKGGPALQEIPGWG